MSLSPYLQPPEQPFQHISSHIIPQLTTSKSWNCYSGYKLYQSGLIFPSLILFQLRWPLCLLEHSRHASASGALHLQLSCLECFTLTGPPCLLHVITETLCSPSGHPDHSIENCILSWYCLWAFPTFIFSPTLTSIQYTIFTNLSLSVVFLSPLKHKLHLATRFICFLTVVSPESGTVPAT